VIVTGDHGEGFREHRRVGHAYGLWGELTNVPLVVLAPALAPKKITTIDTVTGHVDIVPTLLDLMGVPGDRRIQGRSLVPMARAGGRWTPRVIPIEYGRSYALRSRRYKYMVDHVEAEQLFDLQGDPTEQKDLSRKRPLVLRYFRDLTGFYLAHRASWRMQSWGPLNNHKAGFLRHVGAQ
jgi:arylsulfatase A-like enzyme